MRVVDTGWRLCQHIKASVLWGVPQGFVPQARRDIGGIGFAAHFKRFRADHALLHQLGKLVEERGFVRRAELAISAHHIAVFKAKIQHNAYRVEQSRCRNQRGVLRCISCRGSRRSRGC